jgi:hypothetical protein
MHYKDQANGPWKESKARIVPLPDGSAAAATDGPCKAVFPADLYNGALRLTTPDERNLVSRPLGLFYSDGKKTVCIARLREGPIGQLVARGDKVIYTNICTECRVDLVVTYSRWGCESDVVIREQLPDPAQLGFTDPEKVRVQWATEFLDPPEPQKKRQQASSGLEDESLSFGAVKLGRGKGFSIGEEGARNARMPVAKRWVRLPEGRAVLMEEMPFRLIEPELRRLPAHTAAAHGGSSGADGQRLLSEQLLLPPSRPARQTTNTLTLAKSDYLPESGFVLDWVAIVQPDDYELTLERGTTYYVSGQVYLYGLTIEPSVVKYSDNLDDGAMICVGQDPVWRTGPYDMAVFTSKNDDANGEPIDGSSGDPWAGTRSDWSQWPNSYSWAGCPPWLMICPSSELGAHYARFLYAAGSALDFESCPVEVSNCQFVGCGQAIEFGYDACVKLRNVLVTQCGAVAATGYPGTEVRAENVTFDQCSVIAVSTGDMANAYLTNCILANIPDTA